MICQVKLAREICMNRFETLFGIKESEIKKTCILLPIARKDILARLGIKELLKGKLYNSSNSKYFTVIHTGMGPAFLGDAVLYLDHTQCQNIILFGSCGLVKEEENLDTGSLVMPDKCYALESFSQMLLEEKKDWQALYGDNTLLQSFSKSNNAKKVTCATLGSLKLEEGYVDIFEQKQIQVVDMECSALFSAAKYIKRKAMALFYITDIINKKPFYKKLAPEDKTALLSSIKSASDILCEFIQKNLNG